MKNYRRGLAAGIPIALGYLSVSFTFGIMAVSYGLAWWQAVLISMTTVTSAGQFAGIGTMMHPGQYIQMLILQSISAIRLCPSQSVRKQIPNSAAFIVGCSAL